MYIRNLLFLSLFLIVFLIVKCATKGRPGGGPVDEIPPEIIYTFPAQDSLKVSELEEIEIHFSERMDENSVQKSLFISPALEYEIDWSGGDELTLYISPDSLIENQTYVITIGAEAQDVRRNKMKSSFQLAFSTGQYLDKGQISGRIFDLKNNEVMYIYAYEYSENDTIDPRFKKARFLTQSGEKGQFLLGYLPLQNYRIFVVEDQNKNFLLDASYERIGIPTKDIQLDSSKFSVSDLYFKLSQIDTTKPFITSARALYNNTILLRASEELKSITTENLTITDTLQNDTLKIFDLTVSSESNSQYVLYSEPQDSNAYYKVTVSDIMDTSLNLIAEPSIVFFSGTSKKDTTKFTLKTILPPDSAKNFSIFANVTLDFSLPVDTNSLNKAFTFIHEPNDTLIGHWDMNEFRAGEFNAQNKLEPGNDYRIILETRLIKSVWGDTLADTLYNHVFFTVKDEEFGSISGKVLIDSSLFAKMILYTNHTKNKSQSFQAQKMENYQFKIDWLPEGYYLFKGYFDLDHNKKWSPGKLEPFEYAEPVFVKEDTIRVRKRWETSNLILQFQK